MRFRDWKLGTKYAIGVGIVLMLMAAGYASSFRQLEDLKSDLEAVSRNWMGRIIAISNISRHVSDLRMLQLQYAVVSDSLLQTEQGQGMIGLIDLINDSRDRFETLRAQATGEMLFAEREEELYEQFDRHWDRYQTYSLSIVEFAMSGETSEALRVLSGDARPVFDSMSVSLSGLVEANEAYALNAADRAESSLRHLRGASLFLFLVTVGVSIAFTLWLGQLISSPLRQLGEGAERVAEGDLSVTLPIESKDEVGQLGKAFNRMTVGLREARDRDLAQRASIEQANRELQSALSQLREAQDQLILQEKMASLGKLVAGVSHELNTPTGALLSSSDLTKRIVTKVEAILNDSTAANQDDTLRKLRSLLQSLDENADVTEQAGRRIQEIVSSLRSFVHLDQAEYQTVDIHEGLESSITLLGTENLRRIEIMRDFGKIPLVNCIPGQVNQVFYNVIRNAAEAIEARGVITLQTRAAEQSVTIRISDTGRGIEAGRLKQIYDVGWATAHDRVRMGSGVMTSYNIVRRHGGEFSIDSEVGRGTTVTITLPLDCR